MQTLVEYEKECLNDNSKCLLLYILILDVNPSHPMKFINKQIKVLCVYVCMSFEKATEIYMLQTYIHFYIYRLIERQHVKHFTNKPNKN